MARIVSFGNPAVDVGDTPQAGLRLERMSEARGTPALAHQHRAGVPPTDMPCIPRSRPFPQSDHGRCGAATSPGCAVGTPAAHPNRAPRGGPARPPPSMHTGPPPICGLVYRALRAPRLIDVSPLLSRQGAWGPHPARAPLPDHGTAPGSSAAPRRSRPTLAPEAPAVRLSLRGWHGSRFSS
jgi:hypothetical protein